MPAGNISLMQSSGEMLSHSTAFVLKNVDEVTMGGNFLPSP